MNLRGERDENMVRVRGEVVNDSEGMIAILMRSSKRVRDFLSEQMFKYSRVCYFCYCYLDFIDVSICGLRLFKWKREGGQV